MLQELIDDKSTLVQVMAWYHQATSHHLSQSWQVSMSRCGLTRPQWVKTYAVKQHLGKLTTILTTAIQWLRKNIDLGIHRRRLGPSKPAYPKISLSLEAPSLNYHITLKFDRHISNTIAEEPVKFQSDHTILNSNLAASSLCEIGK